jgi:hypothetical protein
MLKHRSCLSHHAYGELPVCSFLNAPCNSRAMERELQVGYLRLYLCQLGNQPPRVSRKYNLIDGSSSAADIASQSTSGQSAFIRLYLPLLVAIRHLVITSSRHVLAPGSAMLQAGTTTGRVTAKKLQLGQFSGCT